MLLFLKSPRPSFLIKRGALGNLKASFHCTHWHRFFPLKKAFSKTYPSFLTLKEGSTFLTKPLFPQGREDVTAPTRCSEPLRSKVGGPSKVCAIFCGMGPPGIAVYSLQLIVYFLRLISWLFADNLQISCDFLGGFEEKA